MLEAHQHESSFFATLTYSQEELPADGSVSVREGQLFLKRLRALSEPVQIRFFLVGEYGARTWRPHYHACLFGLRDPLAVARAWTKGFVQVLPLTYELAQYCCGYAVKSLTRSDDVRLAGRFPEFARMSLRPGIGAGAAEAIRDAVLDPETGELKFRDDVPSAVRVSGRLWPVGRYIRRRVRLACGLGVAEPARAARARLLADMEKFPIYSGDAKEQKRVQDSRIARARDEIQRLKRGL